MKEHSICKLWDRDGLVTLTSKQTQFFLTTKAALTVERHPVPEQILTLKHGMSSCAEEAELQLMQVFLMVAISTLKAIFWLLSLMKIAILLLMRSRPKVVALISMSPMFSGLHQ